ncbi:ankyrin repeat protein [Aspergillus terreus]|uniref:Ankyrin repeat protein n=1 Tax=Aspergillus terreus TaxID=33178 RepID=A0A5M3Z1Y9_ASPTE|nr:hypothetical protein ATETN484_0007069900 [Aspergillus terreus]GFF16665.1 ankyrin repeat protein [Aspergillus terreus]
MATTSHSYSDPNSSLCSDGGGDPVIDLDVLDSLDLSRSGSSWNYMESCITATRNGKSSLLSSISQFTAILAQTGIEGPWISRTPNLAKMAIKIGAGAQFTVFKEKPEYDTKPQPVVIKRVNVPLSQDEGGHFAAGHTYRLQLRTLGLEVMALTNPSLRSHPNIVRLIAWGYDYPFFDMPVPVLYMETALTSLTSLLAVNSEHNCTVDVKYQLSLDIANGIEALHRLRIVHGDLKPDNVLVFRTQNDDVPFRGKLSDFGVCLDLETPNSPFSLSDYRGTPGWLAPEIVNDDLSRFPPFQPDLMFHFDAYSFGLTVLSVFTNHGGPFAQVTTESATQMILQESNLTSTLRMTLGKAIPKLLHEDPTQRPLPSTRLLETETTAYDSWLLSCRIKSEGNVNRIIQELIKQYAASKSDFSGSVLFGMAQAITGQYPYVPGRFEMYLTDASKAGHSPARAVYAQIMAALGHSLACEPEVLEEWMYQAVSQGYLFAPASALTAARKTHALSIFRDSGGFCTGPFLQKPTVVKAARSTESSLLWIDKHGLFVDQMGNTILHAAAAIGEVDTVRALIETAKISVDIENDNGETPLYMASQAGHAEVIMLLIQMNADASRTTRQTKLSPLHWLFVLPESMIRSIAAQLVAAGADVNAVMRPIVSKNANDFSLRMLVLHYPFELPYGTPLHWAAFFRNLVAMEALIQLGAHVDATYHASDSGSRPLALAVWLGDLEVADCLIRHGADGTLTDSHGQNLLHKSGADINAKARDYNASTPIAVASRAGIRNGGVVIALLDSGAELEGSTMGLGNSVLHAWASTMVGSLNYPCSYVPTIERIATAMSNVNLRNEFRETPLHLLAWSYFPEDTFEKACEILLAHKPAVDLNAQTCKGVTPLSIAFSIRGDAARRGLFLLDKGALPDILSDRGQDILYWVADNEALSDQATCDLIIIILQRMSTTSNIYETYQLRFLHNQMSNWTLFRAASLGKLQTTILLLSLGLRTRINDLLPDTNCTVLDTVLHQAENYRRNHMEQLAKYKPGPARRAAVAAVALHSHEHQGGKTYQRAEAYHAFPKIMRSLREAGAQRRCELESGTTDSTDMDGTYINQPQLWDWAFIYMSGFTPATQPHREQWAMLYELARYPTEWPVVDYMVEWYENNTWRPDVRFIEEEKDGDVVRQVIARIGQPVEDKERAVRLKAIDPVMGSVEVTVVDREIVKRTKIDAFVLWDFIAP